MTDDQKGKAKIQYNKMELETQQALVNKKRQSALTPKKQKDINEALDNYSLFREYSPQLKKPKSQENSPGFPKKLLNLQENVDTPEKNINLSNDNASALDSELRDNTLYVLSIHTVSLCFFIFGNLKN